ncbi:MAG: lipoyl synthase [candidate division Zixibacteria bacterium]|nr:lipoyl synthase [candidate division Zixibacteria bacterium]
MSTGTRTATAPLGYDTSAGDGGGGGGRCGPSQIKHKSARLPPWLKITAGFDPEYVRVKKIVESNGLHTVCGEAACPNIRECWGEGTATFMILGKLCTRGCNFCDVLTGRPIELDTDEPRRLAEGVSQLGLRQVVITSVTRDDLEDGGAVIFAETIRELRMRDPLVKIEILIPDMRGSKKAVQITLDARPDVFAHNVETVQRLYKRVRPGARLKRSLGILKMASQDKLQPVVKTGFMVGLGETREEIIELFHQIRATGCQIVTLGQYLRPSDRHLPVERYYPPEEFVDLASIGNDIGFEHVEAGPLVRSSYKAFNQSKKLLERKYSS